MREENLFTGERFLPGINDTKLEIEHYQRYLSVQRFVRDKIVLDAACGEGYGSDILAKYAKKVIGIDLDNETINRAKTKYKSRDNLIFQQGNIEKLKIEDCSIDIVISFETIEHVSEETQKNFLNEIDRVLKDDGIMVMSTPNKRIYSDLHNYNNEFHIKEFYHKDFLEFLHEKFQYVKLYNQSFKVFSVIDSCNGEDDDITYYSRNRNYNSDGKYYIAVASHKEVDKGSLSCLYVDNQNEYEENIERILILQKEQENRNLHIQRLDKELRNREIMIQELQKENSDRNEHIKKLDGEIIMLQKEEENRNLHIQKLDKELQNREITIQELQKENSNRNEHIKKLDGEILVLQKEEESRNLHIQKLDKELQNREITIQELQKENSNRNEHIKKLDGEILILQKEEESRNLHIQKLDKELQSREITIQDLQKENSDRNEHIKKLDNEIEKNNEIIRSLQRENADRNSHIIHLDIVIEQNNQVIEQQRRMSASQLEQIAKQSDLIVHQTERLLEQTEKIGKNSEQNIRQIEQIEQLYQTIGQQSEEISKYCEKEQEYKHQITELLQISDQQRLEHERKIADILRINDTKEQEYEQKTVELYHTNDVKIQEYEQRIAEMQQIILNKEGHIELLLEVERTYEREKNTHSYRVGKKLQKVGDFLLPPDSKRRFFLRVTFNLFKNPLLMIHVINPKRIKNYIKYMRLEGIEGVKKRYEEAIDLEKMQLYPGDKLDLDLEEICNAKNGDEQTIGEYDNLVIPWSINPKVSIIIPVYNEFHYTYCCLKSILRNSGDVSYEVIIANDCSTDLTRDIKKIVDNINVVTTKENVRFLLNCNNAAKYAKGKYIIFLNNDTQVQENWLKPLVELIESDDKIGMVGSKLIYPDGMLQEAGGILWRDGSAWNYGNRKNPSDPEYNYVKEADYISGAAIMIRKNLWNKIGGFDQNFAPAYYEDTDLAFEVRKHGYKVMYQPLSMVVHFEGVSNGTDIENGQKQYQQVNCQKFYDKWKYVLESEHESNGINVFLAKDRSIHKKHILVVDHYVPHYDQDAGGKCTYMYLKLFVKMGFQVTFIGDNFYKHEPYTTELNQMGIEVLYGNYYYNNWQEWLKENSHYFDYIYLQRPHIAVKYIDLVRQYSHAKILYFAHDLHHIREYREYEMTKDPKKLESSQNWKETEYNLFSKADVGHVVGSYEQKIMQKAFPNKPIRNIPLYIYDKILDDINKKFKERHDLLYVGGFGHPPNVDAVLWFASEIFPIVVNKYPNIKWHIVGGKVTKEIENLASDNIIIEGFVSDEYLENLYRTCRMAVVPLRFGAGVKGKVVEAGYFQIPLVTTSIGAEGLNIEDGSMMVEDDEKRMANLICDLYCNYDKLKEMSNNGKNFIEKNFMMSEAERVIRLDLNI